MCVAGPRVATRRCFVFAVVRVSWQPAPLQMFADVPLARARR